MEGDDIGDFVELVFVVNHILQMNMTTGVHFVNFGRIVEIPARQLHHQHTHTKNVLNTAVSVVNYVQVVGFEEDTLFSGRKRNDIEVSPV